MKYEILTYKKLRYLNLKILNQNIMFIKYNSSIIYEKLKR